MARLPTELADLVPDPGWLPNVRPEYYIVITAAIVLLVLVITARRNRPRRSLIRRYLWIAAFILLLIGLVVIFAPGIEIRPLD